MSETGLQAGGAAAVEVRPKGDDAVDANGGTRARGAPACRYPCRRALAAEPTRDGCEKAYCPACLPPRPGQHRILACVLHAGPRETGCRRIWGTSAAPKRLSPASACALCSRSAVSRGAGLLSPDLLRMSASTFRLPTALPRSTSPVGTDTGLLPLSVRLCICASPQPPVNQHRPPVTLSLSPPPPLSSCVCLCGFAVSAW